MGNNKKVLKNKSTISDKKAGNFQTPLASLKKLKVIDFDARAYVKSVHSIEKSTLKTFNVPSNLIELRENQFETSLVSFAQYNGKYDSMANKFKPGAKKLYKEADKEFYRKTNDNMKIYSGFRTVRHQANLYINHNIFEKGNSASWPGCALHNWGLAADMYRNNEAAMSSAMTANGWKRTVKHEGWHFECISAPEYANAKSKIAGLRKKPTGLAWLWSWNMYSYYQKLKDYNKKVRPYNSRLTKFNEEVQKFNPALESYRRRSKQQKTVWAKWGRDAASYKNRVNHYNREFDRAKRLHSQIVNMPPGPAQEAKIREYNNLVDWVHLHGPVLEREFDNLERRRIRVNANADSLNREKQKLEQWLKELKQEQSWLKQEKKYLIKLETEIKKHDTEKEKYLSQIESQVSRG